MVSDYSVGRIATGIEKIGNAMEKIANSVAKAADTYVNNSTTKRAGQE